jgi:large subunit ribosomal protein L9
MPSTLQVILQSDVQNVGQSGELVRVRPGFARNFLIPRGFALPATEGAVNRLNHEKSVALAKFEKTKKEARAVAEKIGSITIKMVRSVGDDNKLFGAVTAKEIEAAAKAAGLVFEKKKMHLPEPIRTLGLFEVPIKLMAEVTAMLKVEVSKK